MTSTIRQRTTSLLRTRVFAIGLASAIGVQAMAAQAAPKATPERKATVAVLEFDNGAMVKRDEYAGLSIGVQIMLTNALAANQSIELVERQRINQVLAEQNLTAAGRVDAATASQVGKLIGARHILVGGFVVQPDNEMRLTVRSVNTETSAIEYTDEVTGKGDKIFKLIDQLAVKLNAGLKLPGIRNEKAAKDGGGDGPNQLEAMRALSAARRLEEQGDLKGAISMYQKTVQLNSALGEPRVRLALLEKK
ncbi:MAG: CsgG/HfaB family protein [Gemmatimonas sp.]